MKFKITKVIFETLSTHKKYLLVDLPTKKKKKKYLHELTVWHERRTYEK